MSTLQAFLAHPKGLEDAQIDGLAEMARDTMQRLIEKYGGKRTPVVVTGRDDFNANAFAMGGWEGWTHDVACGTTMRDGALGPRFDVIILTPSPVFGRATAQIIDAALKAKKPVYFMPGEKEDADLGLFYPVTQVITRDDRNFKQGYTVRYGASQ